MHNRPASWGSSTARPAGSPGNDLAGCPKLSPEIKVARTSSPRRTPSENGFVMPFVGRLRQAKGFLATGIHGSKQGLDQANGGAGRPADVAPQAVRATPGRAKLPQLATRGPGAARHATPNREGAPGRVGEAWGTRNRG